MKISDFSNMLFRTFMQWQKHDATLRAAALTFFTILPLPSIVLIALAILAQVYGQEQALQQLISQVSAVAGPSIANLLSQLLQDAQSPLTSIFGSLIAVVFAVLGAIGAFSVLQKSIDIIWEIRPDERGRGGFIKEKVFAFTLIVGLGLIVVAWTAFSTALFDFIVLYFQPLFGSLAPLFLTVLEIILSLVLGTLLFALVFKLLPETTVEWRDVWLAAIITGVIFTVLNYLFDVYLSLVQVTTLAGTAGTLMVLFLWVYLTNLFILYGAQFSKVYAQTHGSQRNKPRPPPKKPPKPDVDRVEMKSEIDIKVQPDNKNMSSSKNAL
jgi:membrane protein